MAISSERLFLAFAAIAALACAPIAASQAVQGGALPVPLPLFPPDNWWNVDVSQAPLDVNSAAFITWIGTAKGLHPDLGGDSSPSPQIYGMPFIVVPGNEPLEPVAFDYVDESDPGAPGRPAGYPIPAEAISQSKWIEGGYPGEPHGRRRQAHAHRGQGQPCSVRDVEHAVQHRDAVLGSRLRGRLPPRLEPAPARHVDQRRRRGPRDPARAHPLRRGLRHRRPSSTPSASPSAPRTATSPRRRTSPARRRERRPWERGCG